VWSRQSYLHCRFNTSVQFGLPDEACRAQILHQYAQHLSEEELASLAEATPGMAGRDLKDLSEQAERRWASKVGFVHGIHVSLRVTHMSPASFMCKPYQMHHHNTSIPTRTQRQAKAAFVWP